MRRSYKIVLVFFLNWALFTSVQARNFQSGKIEIMPEKIIQVSDSDVNEKPWALATLSVSNIRSKAGHSSELVTQVLMGTPLKVLETTEGWFRVETPEHYIGWMDSFGLACFTDAEMIKWKTSPRFFFRQITGNVVSSPNKKAPVISDLVLGDLFVFEGASKGFLKIRIPDGRTGFVRKSDCISFQDWTEQKPDAQQLIVVARKMLGSPYLWGGTSTKGVDCSGFTKNAYFAQGIILERDAYQQAGHGEHPDFTQISQLQPGDLLFFGRDNQKITHVGMYIGNGFYIHASGLVRINNIGPNHPAYILTEMKKLVAASRILNSLNTEGITLVKDHPWYAAPKNYRNDR